MKIYPACVSVLLSCIMVFVGVSSAAVVLDVSFDHLVNDADGFTSDGQLCVDDSGNGYHGFYSGSGGVVTTGPTGTTALDTSTNDSYIILRDDRTYTGHGEPGIADPITTPTPYFTLEAAKSYTFEAVLKWDPASGDGRHGIMGQTGGNEFWLAEDNGYLLWAMVSGVSANNFGTAVDISSLEADGLWHHLAVVLDRTASEIRVYADYNLIYTDTNPNIGSLGAMLSGTGDFRLGDYNTTSSARFDGVQDGYVISDEALGIGTFVLSGIDFAVVATDPVPTDHVAGVDPNVVLGWSASQAGSFTYDVYFGTDPGSLSLESPSQSEMSFDPLGVVELDWNTPYYWRIDLHDDGQVNEGTVWDFTTTKPVCSPPLPGDISGDCVVDMTDLILLMENWLTQ